MPRLFRSTPWLLVQTGILLGSMLATVNWAGKAGWGALLFTAAPLLLSGSVLAALGTIQEGAQSVRFWCYSALSGALGIAFPNLIVFLTLQKDSVITASVFYLLAPVFTQGLSWLFGHERPSLSRVVGISLGLLGALILVLGPAWEAGRLEEQHVPWMGLFIPLSLSLGNIYRKRFMPGGMGEPMLAGGMLLASGLGLVPVMALWPSWSEGAMAAGGWEPLVLQVAVMVFGFASYFRFLRVVDPVYFSQLGYVVTLTGGIAGILVFGDQLGGHHLISVALVVAGIWLVNRAGIVGKLGFRR
ncbi:EamA family transporter [Marinobacteraceae bacterium S3BR75-40.1]